VVASVEEQASLMQEWGVLRPRGRSLVWREGGGVRWVGLERGVQ